MSTKLTFPRNLTAALRGADDLTVFVPADSARAEWRSALPDGFAELGSELAHDLEPGRLGQSRTTLTQRQPARLTLAVVPATGSRHTDGARSEALRVRAAEAGWSAPGKHLAVVVLEDPGHALAAVNALARTIPLYDRRTTSQGKSELRVVALDPTGQPITIGRDVRAIVDSTREATRLVDTPPTDLDPAKLAREAKRLLRGLERVTIKEISGANLLRNGLGGIHAVGRSALAPPRLLIAEYRPTRAGKDRPHVALVGKGITYDTGGLSLKVGGAMVGMKGDMGGAAAVLGAFRSLVQNGEPLRLTLLLAMAENAIGPASYKPDDVLEMHSKKTVEINNTDAEGRLLLADAVSWAARKAKADVVLDAATLTGAQLVATGNHFAAVVANDEALEQTFVTAGRRSGDLVHPLPFAPEFFQAEFESHVADMKNSVKDRMNAQSSCAAQFVHAHLDGTDVRWGHVDLAGPAFRAERGTGFGVALLAETVRAL